MKDEKLKKMTTKQKQVIAAKCFSKYCEEKNNRHNSIDKLVEHLISIENFENIVDWEQKGTQLELVGRGDEIPKSIDNIISLKDKSTFNELLECAVEVGIIDLYGAETENPKLFLEKCIRILKKNNISLPTI